MIGFGRSSQSRSLVGLSVFLFLLSLLFGPVVDIRERVRSTRCEPSLFPFHFSSFLPFILPFLLLLSSKLSSESELDRDAVSVLFVLSLKKKNER